MIQNIRNPWIRRPLAVVGAFLYVPAVMILGAMVAVDEAWPDVVAAWRGPRRR
jgi:hypothetical protein